jgi:hypothetical protein
MIFIPDRSLLPLKDIVIVDTLGISNMGSEFPAQWQCLLKNSGRWEGSFARFSTMGALQNENPSCVSLEGLDENQVMRQTVRQYSSETGELSQEQILEYRSLARSVLFFEQGHFSQGSLQFGPFSEFGAELGFIHGDRRLRIVPLFDTTSALASITLIREHRQNTPPAERPLLTVDQLQGIWQGEGVTLYPDWRSPDLFQTTLQIHPEGNCWVQQLQAPGITLRSTATLSGNRLLFQDQRYPVQVCLLPDGASVNTPLEIPRQQPFRLEAGWLVQPDLRLRMIRSYDAQGSWISLTLLTEIRMG